MLRLSRSVPSVLATVWLALALPSRAHACGPYPSCPAVGATLPRDGATDVPTNAWIRVEAVGGICDATRCDGLALQLREAGGAEIELDVVISTLFPTWLQSARPRTPLAARTTYELVELAGPCRVGAESVLATFTTGDGEDATPPAPPGLDAVWCRSDSCAESSCCGPYSGTIFDVLAEHGADDASAAQDLRFELGTPEAVRLPSAPAPLRFLQGVPPNGVGGWPSVGPVVRLRTLDLAGNASEAIDVEIACVPAALDAGVDAGAPSVTGGAGTCSVGAPARAPALAAIAWIAVLAARARRRRRI